MYSLSKLLDELGIPYKRAGKRQEDTFGYFMAPLDADDSSLIFFNKVDEGMYEFLSSGRYAVVLLEEVWGIKHFDEINEMEISAFLVEHPRLVVRRVLALVYPNDDMYDAGVHPTAHVNPEAIIHPSVSIGPYCIIGRCEIGKNSSIRSFTIIKDNTVIGENVIIREFCFIGGCGFGFVRDYDGHLERMPHIGRVIIEDDVELFPYVNVDRGTLGETRIKRGAKIDHYAHIGHNSIVGDHCVITAGTVLCGGSSIGARSWAGVGSIIKEKVSVGDDVTLGLGSVVTRKIGDGYVVAGAPARRLRERS
jgi:UDP-3-O-[3-hydroxymyristoyl] glucosamine N-acyltransferase